MALSVIILAAGKGTRMKSSLPKVLNKIAHKPMVEHIIDNVYTLGCQNINLVYGHGGDLLKTELSQHKVNWCLQAEQLGTGHAVMQAVDNITDADDVLILVGDAPLISSSTLQALVAAKQNAELALLTVNLDDPTGMGRIVRDPNTNNITAIVEHKDATDEQRSIQEINTGMMIMQGSDLKRWLGNLSNDNAQNEYYLTDLIAMAATEGKRISAAQPQWHREVEGVNNRAQLASLERAYQLREANQLMLRGVSLADPNRIDVRGEVNTGEDVYIDVNVVFEGKVSLGNKVTIGANCILKNCTVADNANIEAYSLLENAHVGENCQVGPYARLRPGAELHEGAKIGNFVEVKKSVIGKGSKVNHLSYIGDATIGQKSNIGAGTITCNYDGVNKSQTIIGDDAFIGSNSALVAPVTIGDGATVGAGSTISKSVDNEQLAIARGKQRNISGWAKANEKELRNANTMCGIVGAVAERNVVQILLEGLKRLEYRGYDSAGVALVNTRADNSLSIVRRTGKVKELVDAIDDTNGLGTTGIAHTRWATHGGVTEANAHPHASEQRFAVVHNGIIENHKSLRDSLHAKGYEFLSDTDTETIAHSVALQMQTNNNLFSAVQQAVKTFEGAYGTVVMDKTTPDKLVVARSGSPLVIGLGIGENFLASDQMALLPVTRRFIFLEEGDVAQITRTSVDIVDSNGKPVRREVIESTVEHDAGDKGGYRHYMLKEIYEQPHVLRNALKGRVSSEGLVEGIFGEGADTIFEQTEYVKIIACGTSYHAGVTAKYWLEQYGNVQCDVEIASEFRYRKSYVPKNSLLVTISQSGETADTLAALKLAKESGYMSSLSICNVDGSSLVRESALSFLTRAGAEIGVASTKAFTTQLAALLMLTMSIGKYKNIDTQISNNILNALISLPSKLEETLALAGEIEDLAEEFSDKHHSLFLGRGDQYPIAMEGALKLKEISYIHAEAYASGELKHGPLALIDADMPVIVVAPNNELLEKLKSNVEEVRARGGIMYVFADKNAHFETDETMRVVQVPHCMESVAPIVYTIPLQLLSYYVALIKGTDVDQPRNLAKSVTVE